MQGGDGDRERRDPYLPDDYYLDETSERGCVILYADDGREVAWFSATGVDPKEIERRAWEDFGGRTSQDDGA
jgi:hypothetical protein